MFREYAERLHAYAERKLQALSSVKAGAIQKHLPRLLSIMDSYLGIIIILHLNRWGSSQVQTLLRTTLKLEVSN